MAANNYEGMFLLDSTKFSADPDAVVNEVLGILQKAGATVVAHRPWQEGKLAYPIEGHRKGVHYLTLFQMDGKQMPRIDREVHLSETILRYLVIKQHQAVFDAMLSVLKGEGSTEEAGGDLKPVAGSEQAEEGSSSQATVESSSSS